MDNKNIERVPLYGYSFEDKKEKPSENTKKSNDSTKKGGEIVQKAAHYQNIPIVDRNGNTTELEAWEIITSLLNYLNLSPRAAWAMGDALKYILRCGRKFGDQTAVSNHDKAVQDLRKATYYLEKVADWY